MFIGWGIHLKKRNIHHLCSTGLEVTPKMYNRQHFLKNSVNDMMDLEFPN